MKGEFTNYRQWDNNPSSVAFTPLNREPMKLTPQNTRRFVIDHYDVYESFSGQRMINPTDVATAQQTMMPRDAVFTDVTAFLRFVGEAKGVSIWVLNDNRRINFYSRQGTEPFVELRFHSVAEGTEYQEMPVYREQLKSLYDLHDSRLRFRVNNMLYTESSMKDLLQALGEKRNKKKVKMTCLVSLPLAVSHRTR